MRSEELAIEANGVRLAGSLVWPTGEGPFPLVLMIHGSGPLDRNENTRGQALNIFNVIAEDLAGMGVASFRYDKRGNGRSSGNFQRAGVTELLGDAVACLDHLAEHHGGQISARYLLGHSEGTLIAAHMSAQRQVDGLILLAPFIEDMEKILRDQAAKADRMIGEMKGIDGWLVRAITFFSGPPSRQQDRIITKVRSSSRDTVKVGRQKLPAKWLRELLETDTEAVYANVKVPTLLIGGDKDLQCNPADVGRIADRLGDLATPHLLDDLTHILRRQSGPHTFADYAKLMTQPIDGEITRLIGDWLEQQQADEASPPSS